MNVLIAGGTGFIGQALTKHYLFQSHGVTILGRDVKKIQRQYGHEVEAISWEGFRTQHQKILKPIDVIINLAGTNIGQGRWTPERKNEILQSRINTTQLITESCLKLLKPITLFNASALSIYGLQKPSPFAPHLYDETTRINFNQGTEFLSKVARLWEKATHKAQTKEVRVINMRFAPVLDKNGLLDKLKLPYQLGLGGPVGSGDQLFSWIALIDVIAAIDFLINAVHIQGPVNFVAPQCITQKQFAKALSQALHRSCFLRTPKFIVRSLFGEMADELLLNGQCAYPKVLLDHGFQFSFTDINTILQHIYH